MKQIVLLLLVLSIPSLAWAEDIYLKYPLGTGAQNGQSCADARIYSFFNSLGNWGVGANLIGAGDTVHICPPAWTGAANIEFLKFQGSGTAGSVITLIFESGAVLEAPYFSTTSAAINLNGKSYLLIDGGATCGIVSHVMVPLANCNGIIRTTANGTSPTYANSQPVNYGILQTGDPTDIEIRNLIIGPIYQRVDPHLTTNPIDGEVPGGGTTAGIRFDHSGVTNLRIHHNNVQHARVNMSLNFETKSPTNWQVYNNYVADQGWGIVLSGAGTGTFLTNVQLHDNEITNWDMWVSPSGHFHSNGYFIYNNCAQTTPEVMDCRAGDDNSNIYNNYIHGDLKGNWTGGNPSGYIHAPARGSFNVFNNLLVANAPLETASAFYLLGCLSWSPSSCGGGMRMYNNTVLLANGKCADTDVLTANIFKNNICMRILGGSANAKGWSATRNTPLGYELFTSDYNNAFNLTLWECKNSAITQDCRSMASAKLGLPAGSPVHDTNSVNADPLLDSNYRPQVGSPAINAGTNLTSLGISALNVDYWGAARPASGAWTIGAMNLSDTLAPAAPTNITVQ